MVEIDLDQLMQALEQAGIKSEKITQIFKDTADAAKALGSVTFDNVTNSLKTYVTVLKDTNVNSNTLRSNNISVSSSFDSVAKSLSTVLALTTKFDAFKGLSVQGGAAVQTMGSQFDSLIERFGGWERASQKLVGAGLSNIVAMGAKGAGAFLDSASSAQQLENTYINLQAATGQLGNIFDQNNQIVSNLSGQVARYGAHLNDVASITNENIEAVAKWSTQFGTIPNVLGTLIKVGDGAEDSMDGLTAAFTLARGAGRDVSEVYKAMTVAYENLGNAQGKVTDNAKRGAEMFALMSEASNKLGLRFDDTEGFLTNVAQQFKLVGDNTESSIRVLERFSGALQNTGLTAKASVELVGGMVDAMKRLDIGTKALISSRTGGPGGLQGAFRIDNLLREGKMDEVAKMMEQTLRQQFRGRIYTQAEAAQSPQAAAQFMRQRTMLQSGAFGSLASSPEAASRLLEAMKSGPVATTAAVKDAFSSLKDTTAKGSELQQKQVNVLNLIHNSMNRSITLQELQFLATAREALGGEGSNNAMADAFKAARTAAQQDIIEQYGSGNKEVKSLDEQQKRANRISGAEAIDSFGALPNIKNVGANVISDAGATVKTWVQRMQEDGKKAQDVNAVTTEQQRTQRAVQNGRTMRGATAQAMRQAPATMAATVPKATDLVKHEVQVKPLEVNIQVTRDRDTQVTTTTNYPNANVRDVVNQSVKGYQEVVKP